MGFLNFQILLAGNCFTVKQPSKLVFQHPSCKKNIPDQIHPWALKNCQDKPLYTINLKHTYTAHLQNPARKSFPRLP